MLEGADTEQVWAQLALLNTGLAVFLSKSVKQALVAPVALAEAVSPEKTAKKSESEGEESGEGAGDAEAFPPSGEEEDSEEKKDFFDADEMERFVQEAEGEEQEKKNGGGENGEFEEEDLGLFEAGQDEDDAVIDLKYEDFFSGEGREKKEANDEFDFVEHEEGDLELLSAFELRAKEIAAQISDLEKKSVGDKHWALAGEVTIRDRPQSSLLESYMDFDQVTFFCCFYIYFFRLIFFFFWQVSQGVPMLTEEHTARIESVVKKRSLEGTFDDVVRRLENAMEFSRRTKSRVTLEFQQSEKGLGQVFEDEYLKAVNLTDSNNLNYSNSNNDSNSNETEAQREARRMFRELCVSLDVLTNDHYRPSVPDAKEKKIDSKDVPAIQLEEIAPAGTSGAGMLVPEEISGRARAGALFGEKEMGKEEKKKHRRLRKIAAQKKKEEKKNQMAARAAVDSDFAEKLKTMQSTALVVATSGEKKAGKKIKTTHAAGGKYAKSGVFFANLQAASGAEAEEKKRGEKKKAGAEGSAAKYKL